MDKIKNIDWNSIAEDLYAKGYAIIPQFLSDIQCHQIINGYDTDKFRKTVVMERYRYGLGEYKYYDYPLPEIVQTIRENLYLHLVSVANAWMNALKINKQYPDNLEKLHKLCANESQLKPTALILKYGKGGYNTLHQDMYGEVFFPMQAAVFLNQSGVDYTGGEFVLTEQIPRAQSKAIVLNPNKGDMLIFTTNFRPVKGIRGYYRANMKHGVSEIHSGERHTLGIIFHDALK